MAVENPAAGHVTFDLPQGERNFATIQIGGLPVQPLDGVSFVTVPSSFLSTPKPGKSPNDVIRAQPSDWTETSLAKVTSSGASAELANSTGWSARFQTGLRGEMVRFAKRIAVKPVGTASSLAAWCWLGC